MLVRKGYHLVLAVNVALRTTRRTPGKLLTACARGEAPFAGNPAQSSKDSIMTALFDIQGAHWPRDADGLCYPPAEMFVNISNTNAREFLDWIDLEHTELWGEMKARELVALLRRRLWPEMRNRDDSGRPSLIDCSSSGAVVITFGREGGKLACYAERLLILAEYAGDGTIIWS
ncbi:MAG: hypothetical protein ACJ8R9_31175 [Steroidobacteraceae bacterium]